jgi:hypothetical protein
LLMWITTGSIETMTAERMARLIQRQGVLMLRGALSST